jgi:hypothetical protein
MILPTLDLTCFVKIVCSLTLGNCVKMRHHQKLLFSCMSQSEGSAMVLAIRHGVFPKLIGQWPDWRIDKAVTGYCVSIARKSDGTRVAEAAGIRL